jgi:predicted enzyme related to lactoylglutathione lyase
MTRNPVGWFEIYVKDMNRAKAFYERVLNVSLTGLPSDLPDIQMLVFPMTDDAPGCPGALAKMDGFEPGGGGVLVYFSCNDCSVECSRVAPAGGSVVKPKFAIGEYGFISLVVDTEGNMIGLHSRE